MSTYLRVVPFEEIDARTLAHIQRTARQSHCNFTVYEGAVTQTIYVCMHRAKTPSAEFIRQYEATEFAALPIASATQ